MIFIIFQILCKFHPNKLPFRSNKRNPKRKKSRKRRKKSMRTLWKIFHLQLSLALHILLSILEYSPDNRKIHRIVNHVVLNFQGNSDISVVPKAPTAISCVLPAKYALKIIFWDLWYQSNNSRTTLCTAKINTTAMDVWRTSKLMKREFGTVDLVVFRSVLSVWIRPMPSGKT